MPYLVCDMPPASEGVEYYTIVGIPGNPQSPKLTTGAYGFKFDLKDVPPGTYSVQCSACNQWACSLPSPLSFTRPVSALSPKGLAIAFG